MPQTPANPPATNATRARPNHALRLLTPRAERHRRSSYPRAPPQRCFPTYDLITESPAVVRTDRVGSLRSSGGHAAAALSNSAGQAGQAPTQCAYCCKRRRGWLAGRTPPRAQFACSSISMTSIASAETADHFASGCLAAKLSIGTRLKRYPSTSMAVW